MNIEKRKRELIDLLNKASYEYYQNSNNIMEDREYDKLYDELVELEKDGIIYGNSPTQKVGYEVMSNLKKVTHGTPMLSLDKTKEVSALESFVSKNETLISWKLDGLTVVLTYENGQLVQGVTRGNGTIGEDITHNAKVFQNLPIKIPTKEKLILRGEAIITFDVFNEINSTLEEDNKYKNPRNLCSGTVRQLNSEIVSNRKVNFIAFTLVNYKDFDMGNKKESLDFLDKNGFDVVENLIIDNVNDSIKYFEEEKLKSNFGTDGLVLTYNSYEYSENLGSTSKFPRDSIAFKWSDEIRQSVLRDVEWNVSRTGVINPVAIFDTVDLEGTEVNRASLHNISIIEGLELGIGDEINIYKANMIIPQISENLTKSNTLEIPKICPSCNADTEIIKQNDGKSLYCTNEKCPDRIIDGIVHFSSRNAMNIEGFSKETIRKFIDNDFISGILDIYYIDKYEDKIVNMAGFGEKSYTKLIQSIENSKNAKVANFIYALGINGVGLAGGKLIAKEIIKDNTIKILFDTKLDDFMNINGFGEVLSKNVFDYFHNEKNQELINNFCDILNFEYVAPTNNTMDGITICITGSLNKFNNRKDLGKLIEDMGGKVSSSVSKNTNYLINNDTTSSSSKNKKAQSLDIPIISEDEFIELFSI